jgi:class 3 adenylate cyclase
VIDPSAEPSGGDVSPLAHRFARPGLRRGLAAALVVVAFVAMVAALLRGLGLGGPLQVTERGALLFVLGVLVGGVGILVASRLVESRLGVARRARDLAGSRRRQEARRAAKADEARPRLPDAEAGTHRVEAILLVDLIQSTELITRHGDMFFRDLLRRIEASFIPVARQHGASHIDGQGDGLLFCFAEPAAALAAFRGIRALVPAMNRGLPVPADVAFRGSLHVGETIADARGNRSGLAVLKAVRLGSAMETLRGRGSGRNSLVISQEAVAPLVAAGATVTALGEVTLRGFPGTHAVYEVSTVLTGKGGGD